MRKQLLVVLLPLLVLSAIGETPSAATDTTKRATLQRVDVIRGNDGISVEITSRGQITPTVSTLESPTRVVVSLPNTVAATAQNHLSVDSNGVKGVRIGTDGRTPPTTSVVIDLLNACSYELLPGSDGKVIVKLHPAASSAKTDKPVAAPHAVIAPVSMHRTALTQSAATTPVAASTPAPALDQKPAPQAASAQDFVFVEPSYQAKPAVQGSESAVAAPPVKVVEAAAKFVDKPEGSLLPTPSAAMQQTSQAANATTMQPAVNLAAEQKIQSTQIVSAPEPKYTGEPISVNLKDVDLKDFFRLIHEISGLNVVLDPNVKGSLTIVLDDVPWDQALDIVLKNNDLARQLDGNVLRIATVDTLRHEAESRRAQHDAEALAVDKITFTRFLSYAHAKDLVITCKKFISSRGDVIADERTNAVIVTDVPSVVPAIDKLLTQLDRKTQQVEIEARVVAATRSFARDLGTQLGFGWGNSTTGIGGASAVGTTPTATFGITPLYPIIGSSTPTSTTGVQIPLFSNLGSTSPTSGINITSATANVRLDAVLTMAESRGLVKILSRPRVVTQNNIQALVRQGVRVPIVTQAQLGGPPTVTYVDAFLRLTVVPQITSEGTIFLNVDVENTTPDFGQSIQGNPTLITQQATTQVLVTDGGTVVIGGVIQTNNSVQVSQVPLLGNIPYLGNLFKHTQVSTSNQELIFFITPRIIQT
ncbi:MAG TPA: type IV pilus secretin PilQ [Terriglobales bacterium]|jgi:type IV pilus assembly protein PilQ|nr:type IV pilus secretin PilQ [Terriglobales bacterium]